VPLALATPVIAEDDQLSNGVAACLQQARLALGSTMAFNGHAENERIDAYVAQGKIYFNNPFVSQEPTFAFWKCLRLKGYNIP
jgi:hypothetical protein